MSHLAFYHNLLIALHIIAIIAWMAGLLYLPRLFVYHTPAAVGSEMDQTFQTMERLLYRGIMNPAMIATWVFGIALLTMNPVLLHQGWLIVKLVVVVALTGLHHAMIGWRKAFEQDRNWRSERFFRIANEAPTLALVIVVIMVIVRPF